ncbi:MAG: hypothetical protein A3F84_27770 [Candidatus Handelsmanbacteria bacterium RIFCSPLOWO2_12_FULL_64_10]|uniref:DUF3168 domain-containing protein n=1 Tax=Handelsmanbacteria sp. (strain RIFCSPLOWO2_12_FULL_64_10) TaxID=1817868 RepID=A0A1F6C508_HANXR|nr:MAG: hypothetical protein A3F84_27770 [Candidatus Handelsmanbacteria bacterium RIFCSPLOWO2_12_FULL_64_10]
MSIESGLYDHLRRNGAIADLVGSRIYPQQAERDASLPLIVYQRISTQRGRYNLRTTSGLAGPRIQLDCYGSTYAETKDVADAVLDLIDGYKGLLGASTFTAQGIFVEDERDSQESAGGGSESPTHRIGIDVVIWYGT